MKQLFTAIAILCAAFTASAQSGPLFKEQAQLVQQLTDLKTEFDANEAERGKLAQRWDDLKWTDQQIKKQIGQYNDAQANWDQRAQVQQAATDAHNARCSGTFDDKNYVAQCNAEAAAGNALNQQLNQELEGLNQTKALIRQAIQTQTEETQKVFGREKQLRARQEEIRQMAMPIIARLQAIQAQVDSCKKAIADVDAHPNVPEWKETMHNVCGQMFDGNR